MSEQYTQKSIEVLKRANEYATENANPEICAEHLLFALCEDREGVVYSALKRMGANPDQINIDCDKIIKGMSKVRGASPNYSRNLMEIISFSQNFAKMKSFVPLIRLYR